MQSVRKAEKLATLRLATLLGETGTWMANKNILLIEPGYKNKYHLWD